MQLVENTAVTQSHTSSFECTPYAMY